MIVRLLTHNGSFILILRSMAGQYQQGKNLILIWRVWHGCNYFNGALAFLLGSMILFPQFANLLETALFSAWLFIIGSACFFVADVSEWLYFTGCAQRNFQASFRIVVSILCSSCYLAGSICFLPIQNALALGILLFKIGSTMILALQLWKIYRFYKQPEKQKPLYDKIDLHQFYIDLFVGIGCLMYLLGTFLLEKNDENPELKTITAIVYTFGGILFFIAAVIMQNRYFCRVTREADKQNEVDFDDFM